MLSLFNKNKDIMLEYIFTPKIIKDRFTLCANVDLEDIRKKDRGLYSLLHKFHAWSIIAESGKVYVDYNDFVECVLFYNKSKKYNTFIREVEENITVIDKIVKTLIQDICEKIHDGDIEWLKIQIGGKYCNEIYTQEQHKFLLDYIDYIVSMSVVQELSVAEMCEVAYKYIVNNGNVDMFWSFT